MKRIGFLCTLLLCLFFTHSYAQVQVGDTGELSGLVFSDYYWMAQNQNQNLEGKNGFWIRRVYLTYERELGGSFSSRLRLEMNTPGDFQSDASMVPDVKDAYLKWENEQHQIFAGISSTPTFGLTEDVWGYRSVEKAPQDLYDFASSRDFGVAFQGELDKAGKLNYHFFLGNGNSNGAEVNKGKKFMLALSYEFTENFVLEGYGDVNDGNDGRDSYTAQIFAGYRTDVLKAGALYSYQQRQNLSAVGDVNLDLFSVFSNFKIGEHTDGFLRADHLFDPYLGGSGNDYLPFITGPESTFIVGGLDFTLEEQIHLMPNIEVIAYGEDSLGNSPETTVMPRLTLFYEF